jgi:hypothetical protein
MGQSLWGHAGNQNKGLAGHTGRVLELRPNCECCDVDLPPDAPDARICTFECTWCADCVSGCLDDVCPNCGGELVRRPARPERALAEHPASGVGVHHPTPLHRAGQTGTSSTAPTA